MQASRGTHQLNKVWRPSQAAILKRTPSQAVKFAHAHEKRENPLHETRQVDILFGPESYGAVAQLGERLVRNQQVRGSTPLGSNHIRGAEKSTFYAVFSAVAGQRYVAMSTTQTAAKKFLAGEEVLKNPKSGGRGDSLYTAETRKNTIESLTLSLTKCPQAGQSKILDCLNCFEKHNLCQAKAAHVRRNMAIIKKFCSISGCEKISDISVANIQNYVWKLQNDGFSSKTISNHLAALSAFCGCMEALYRLFPINPVSKVARPPKEEKLPHYLSKGNYEQAERLAEKIIYGLNSRWRATQV